MPTTSLYILAGAEEIIHIGGQQKNAISRYFLFPIGVPLVIIGNACDYLLDIALTPG